MTVMNRTWVVSLGVAAALVLGAGLSLAEVFVLTNGDRVSGKRLKGTKRSFTVQTEFGRLVIPRARVERIVKDDGTQEEINAPGTSPDVPSANAAAPQAAMPRARVVLIVVGKSFWLAWNPKQNPGIDPTVRMEVRLDGEPIASYADTKTDPKDLPGATVNTFSFMEGDFEMEGAAGAVLGPPEVRPGRASLRIDVPFPSDAPPARKLRVTYQFNSGTADEPEWKDLVSAETTMTLLRGQPSFVLLRQDPGKMEYSGFKPRMRKIETFRLDLAPGS
jgi:hypothetical protein